MLRGLETNSYDVWLKKMFSHRLRENMIALQTHEEGCLIEEEENFPLLILKAS